MSHGTHTIVVGGGLIGLTTAWELVSRGESVTVFEAREDVALETSYANGAMLTAAMSDPWNGPGVHRQLAASIFDPHSAMKIRLLALPGLLHWGSRFLRSSSVARHREATRCSYRLAAYSISCLKKLRQTLGLEYHADMVGTMKVFRSQEAMAGPLAIARDLALLGLRFEVLARSDIVAAESQLQPIAHLIAGALRFPDDESGDARLFCQALRRLIVAAGGRIRTGERVERLAVNRHGSAGVLLGKQLCDASRVVVAAGNGTRRLLAKIGLSLAIAPAKGYSVTVARNGLTDWPRLPIIDDEMHAAVVPIGDRLRLVGMAEFAGFDTSIARPRLDMLFGLLESLYPHIYQRVDLSTAEPWAGLRPMSADGLPFIGPTGIDGLYVNSGHGHLGWTMAAGSARLLVDLIQGVAPAIDPRPYRPAR